MLISSYNGVQSGWFSTLIITKTCSSLVLICAFYLVILAKTCLCIFFYHLVYVLGIVLGLLTSSYSYDLMSQCSKRGLLDVF